MRQTSNVNTISFREQLFHLIYEAYMNEDSIETNHPKFDVWYPMKVIKQGHQVLCKVLIDREYHTFPYDMILTSLRVTVVDNKYFILIKFP
jgi:hypothetical protein